MYVKYGIGKKDSNGYSMHRIELEGEIYYELMDSIRALITAKLKKEGIIPRDATFTMIESFVYM